MSNLRATEENVKNKIYLIRNKRVMLDNDLAKLYRVSTSRLNEQVKRNRTRFPSDFIFQLTPDESENLISQFATSSSGWGGRRKLPYAFTEHGAIMAASVLNTQRAIAVSVYVVRAFIKLREMLAAHGDFAQKLDRLERKFDKHDKEIRSIFHVIRQMMAPPKEPKMKIGFYKEPGAMDMRLSLQRA